MQIIQRIIAMALLLGLAFFLFTIGIGLIVFLSVVALLAWVLQPRSRQKWQSQWRTFSAKSANKYTDKYKSAYQRRYTTGKGSEHSTQNAGNSAPQVIEGQYEVVDNKR